MQDHVAPATHHTQRPGRWVSEPSWPPPQAQEWRWDFSPAVPISHRSIESTGIDAGAWCADGGEGDWPGDQRAEDERSLTFTSAPLEEAIEILGFPEVVLEIEVGRPTALAAVRLCDVGPDGASLLITRGVLNLNHRHGHDDAQRLEPGQRYEVTISLDAIAQRVPAGHRLRVAVSTAYWPWVWPTAKPVTLTLHAGRLTAADARAAHRGAARLRSRPSGRRRWRSSGSRPGGRAAPTRTTRPPASTSCASSGTSAAIAASSTAP